MSESIHFYEALEYFAELVRFDSDARIGDVELYFIAFAAISVTDAALSGEFECVTDKIGYHLEYPVLVSFDNDILL